MDEMKNGIQKNRFSWFGRVMRMGEERIPKKMAHTTMKGKRQTEKKNPSKSAGFLPVNLRTREGCVTPEPLRPT